MKQLFSLFFLCAILIGLNQTVQACSEVDATERAALVQLFNATNGSQWTHSWDLSAPVVTWYGVSLSGDGCHVEVIDLDDNNLQGTLPLLNLPHLKAIGLSNNTLQGSIPDFDLPKVENLDLADNQLTGNIPDFRHLPNVKAIYLNRNRLSGELPNFTHLPNLKSLLCNKNSLTGPLPNFSALPLLEQLHLRDNHFTHLPNFSNLPLLQSLYLENNDLEGSLPDFDNLSQLRKLKLGYNRLSGNLPDFGKLPNLEILWLNNNQLSGLLPNFSNLPQLKELTVNFNQLSGTLPAFSKTEDLQVVQVDFNQFTGVVPNWNHLIYLERLYLNDNQLSGKVPTLNQPLLLETDLTFNYLTFNGLEANVPMLKDFTYEQQAQLPITANENELMVEAGGKLKNNTYYWYKDGALVATIDGSNRYTPTEAGMYHCEIRNSVAERLVLQSVKVEMKVAENGALALGNNLGELRNVQVYPNYTEAEVHVGLSLPVAEQISITLFDMAGKSFETQTHNLQAGAHVLDLDLSRYDAGFYLVQIDNGQEKVTKKVLKAQ